MSFESELELALRSASSQAELDAAVDDAISHARAPHTAAAALLDAPSADVAAAARFIVNTSGELGLHPLLETQGLGPPMRAWQIATVTDAAIGLRRRVLVWLLPSLRDKTALPARPNDPAKRRVCDEAYLSLGGLLPVPEEHPARALGRERFLALSEMRRDALIREAVGARGTKRVLGQAE